MLTVYLRLVDVGQLIQIVRSLRLRELTPTERTSYFLPPPTPTPTSTPRYTSTPLPVEFLSLTPSNLLPALQSATAAYLQLNSSPTPTVDFTQTTPTPTYDSTLISATPHPIFETATAGYLQSNSFPADNTNLNPIFRTATAAAFLALPNSQQLVIEATYEAIQQAYASSQPTANLTLVTATDNPSDPLVRTSTAAALPTQTPSATIDPIDLTATVVGIPTRDPLATIDISQPTWTPTATASATFTPRFSATPRPITTATSEVNIASPTIFLHPFYQTATASASPAVWGD